MSSLEHWMREGKIVSFVLGELEAEECALILDAAKQDRAVADAINEVKSQLVQQGIAQARQQDPEAFIQSGMLQAYIQDELADAQRRTVELMVAANSSVAVAFDSIKRTHVEDIMARVRSTDVQALIDSDRLTDYVLGECTAQEALEIELAASMYPEVAEVLDGLRHVNEALVMQASIRPPAAARARFADFIAANEMPADGWAIVMPSISAASQPADFQPWLDRIGAADLNPTENLTAVPLEVDKAMTTLFVVLNELLEEEVHLNAIERFLVLQGSCIVRMGERDVVLQEGDCYSIPKFTPHTVIVTSAIACKLIVQQVAA
jgi:mannose-6-phosphate isomerase-like protein (cupin superfamily)